MFFNKGDAQVEVKGSHRQAGSALQPTIAEQAYWWTSRRAGKIINKDDKSGSDF